MMAVGRACPDSQSSCEFLSKPIGREAVAILLDRLPATPRFRPTKERSFLQIERFVKARIGRRARNIWEDLDQADIYYYESYSKGCLVHHALPSESLRIGPLNFDELLALKSFNLSSDLVKDS